ncbi:hypothetical protein I305_03285 [Cryptococcus gattii E566]|nr:hypothetical protein I305_03285 [Cryptococcus gattii E566]
MGNSWCLDDPYGIIQQFCAENASVGDDTADLRTDNGVSVVAASAGSLSCSDNSVGIFFDQVHVGAELFIGAHVERTVSSEVVEEREGAVDEGYEQRHQVRINAACV